ncbi:MAG: hypothetical protein V1821_01065 [bacterium]
MPSCKQCQKEFEVSSVGQKVLDSFDCPPPVNCPSCDLCLQLSSRNGLHLYQRKCGLCGKSVLAMFAP